MNQKEEFKLEPGDPFAVEGHGLTVWLVTHLLQPYINRTHFGILWHERPDGDFVIIESIARGLSIGLLSWYKGYEMTFYRVNCPADLRHEAPDALVEWGRAHYDYLLILKLAAGAVAAFFKILIKERKIRKLRAEDFPYAENSSLICTEAPDVAYDAVGVNIIPLGVVPIPNAFRQAEIEGRLIRLEANR